MPAGRGNAAYRRAISAMPVPYSAVPVYKAQSTTLSAESSGSYAPGKLQGP